MINLRNKHQPPHIDANNHNRGKLRADEKLNYESS